MKRNRTARPVLFTATALLLSELAGGPVHAGVTPMDYDASVPCRAFQRWGYGGWTAIAPVTLNIDNGVSLSFAPGDSMAPGSTIAGVAVPIILDRHCGNL
ncbi:MAG: hypothetical protein ACHQC9_08280 [Alphaproteobacteria bacterium]